MRRAVIVALASLAAVGIALARGKKADEDASPPPVEAAAAPAAPAPPPAAPPLFPQGLPVAVATLPPGLASLSAQGCNACHYAAHETWAGSRHAIAWFSPSYQQALAAAGQSTACVGCHLPLAPQHDELANGYIDGDLTRPRLTPNPTFDAGLRAEGVTCAACHVRDGTVLGTTASTSAPHPVTVSAELRGSELCATCHQLTWPDGDRPFYDTYGEWKASPWAAANVGCQDCHMAPVAGSATPGSDGTLPSHAFHGDLRRALSVLIDLPAAKLQRGQPVEVGMTVQNTGAGHSFPTGNPFKAGAVTLSFLDAGGKEVAPPWTVSFARTLEMAAPWRTTADTRLLAGGQWSGTHTLTPSLKAAAGMGTVVATVKRGGEAVEVVRLPVDWR